MGISDRFALAKVPRGILLRGNRIAAATAGGRASNAFKQLTERGDRATKHPAILTSCHPTSLR
jgi:hypothetical protein